MKEEMAKIINFKNFIESEIKNYRYGNKSIK